MSIVTVNVNQQVGAAPSIKQRTGAIISTGGTSTTSGTSTLLSQASDLTAILAAAVAITAGSTTWSGGTVTMTTATPHGYTTGDIVTVSGFAGAGYTGYNGTFSITVTGASTFTYAVVATLTSPATGTATVTDADVAELISQVGTFFAQGSSVSVYVLELGHGTVATSVAALAAYITAHPGAYYSFLVPRLWDAESTFVTLCTANEATTSQLYFYITATLSTYASFATVKSAKIVIEAATAPTSEFTCAAFFWLSLSPNPSPTNQLKPMQYGFLFGVTVYPATVTQQATFKTANLDYVASAAEGGISNKMVALGTFCDGKPFNYWYSVDWMQINVNQQIAATVINGSNNALAPLYYDQAGIRQLYTVAQKVAATAVSYGLAIGPVTGYEYTAADFTTLLESGNEPTGVLVNAVPFASYVALNPNDYPIGLYGGLALSYTPQRGFSNIVFNVNVSSFVL